MDERTIIFFLGLLWISHASYVEEFMQIKDPPVFSFASYYGDHMVLQRAPQRAIVWGYASQIGNTVTVTLSGYPGVSTTVQKGPFPDRGIWMVKLPAESGPGPFTINVVSSEGHLELKDVLFGDVWVCSGQSNMQFTVIQAFNGTEEAEDSVKFNQIRLFTAALNFSKKQEYDLLAVEEIWSLPDKDTVGSKPWSYFSAVCWLFGKYLYQKLQVPIGLVDSDWGGTPVEAWSSPDALAQCGMSPQADVSSARVLRQYSKLEGPGERTVLWNAMIHPLLNMTIYGAIWYQGEANQGKPNTYNCTFPAMIDDWREKFNKGSQGETDPTFPFGFVQLAGNKKNAAIGGFPAIRWHQTADFGYVPNFRLKKVFMSVAMDLPDFESPFGSIHPRDKQDVASRLVLSALPVAYGMSAGKWQGPFPSAYLVVIGFFTLVIEYDKQNSTLHVANMDGFEVCCSRNNQSSCDGKDSQWMSTPIIKIEDHRVTMSYKGNCSNQYVMGVRYAWRESPCSFKKCAVYSKENDLPAPPYIALGFFGGGPQHSAQSRFNDRWNPLPL